MTRKNVIVLGVALLAGLPHAVQAQKIGRLDSFWAKWDGFDPEAYVMMKQMGETMGKLQSDASIARQTGDDSALEGKLKDKIGEQVLDWAAELNPAVKPIKSMGDFAIDGTQRWLDWSFRYNVNQMYGVYKKALSETGDVKQAVAAVDRWVDENLETASLAMKEKELQVIKANRGLLLAQIIQSHKQHHPDQYDGIDVGAALRKGGKPGASKNPVAEAVRASVLDCMCRCNSTPNMSVVGVSYDPKPRDASPSCQNPANGACVNQGYGCWRHVPPSSGECVDRCHDQAGIPRGAVAP